LDQLNVIECFEVPSKKLRMREILEKQKQLYIDLGIPLLPRYELRVYRLNSPIYWNLVVLGFDKASIGASAAGGSHRELPLLEPIYWNLVVLGFDKASIGASATGGSHRELPLLGLDKIRQIGISNLGVEKKRV
jgi:hypothetical protein